MAITIIVKEDDGDQVEITLAKHKVIVPFEAIERIWHISCWTGQKKTHPVKYGLEVEP